MVHKLINNGEILEELFTFCHPTDPKTGEKEIKYHVPFLKDFDNKSPMDMLLKNRDYRSMNMMLDFLSCYGIDHHSRAMVEVFSVLIEKELPNLANYIDSRLTQTIHLTHLKKGMIRKSDPPGIAVASFWCNGQDIDHVL